jgi:hypothetical protein
MEAGSASDEKMDLDPNQNQRLNSKTVEAQTGALECREGSVD